MVLELKKNEFADAIRANFAAINDPDKGSTSLLHRVMHKVYVQTRVKNGRYEEYGILENIVSEKVFENMLCGSTLEIVLPDGKSYIAEPEYGDLRIDSYEICKEKGMRFTRNVEVLVGYPRIFYFPCSFDGFELAKEFSHYMLGHNYFTSGMKSKFDSDLKIKRSDFERRNREKIRCSLSNKDRYDELMKNKIYKIHYHISPLVDRHKKINYDDFSGMVEIESEMERKWKNYYYLADKLSFVIDEDFLWEYVVDAKRILEKYEISLSESRLDTMITLSQSDLSKRCSSAKRACKNKCKGIEKCRYDFNKKSECSGNAIVYHTDSVIPISRKKDYLVNMHFRPLEFLLKPASS